MVRDPNWYVEEMSKFLLYYVAIGEQLGGRSINIFACESKFTFKCRLRQQDVQSKILANIWLNAMSSYLQIQHWVRFKE